MSDSQNKLNRLAIPADMNGKTALDMGCNEGFFCNVMAERGAKKVIGLDYDKRVIEFARETYANPAIEFRHQGWATLPDGPFDLVLWSSAMHYEKDPTAVLRKLADRLTPDGILILECGIAGGPTREMVMHQRHDGTLWYPTERHLFDNLLRPLAFRRVAPPQLTPGDALPRSVFHCRRRQPTVLLFRGGTHRGKSAAAHAMQESATQVISLDLYMHRIMTAKYHHTPLQQFVRDNIKPDSLQALYYGIDVNNHTEEYVTLLSQSISPSDRLVVIEGLMTSRQVEALTKVLAGKALVWDVERRSKEEYDEIETLLQSFAIEQTSDSMR